MGALIQPNIWHWARLSDNTPHLDHLSYPAQSFHLNTYLHNRDHLYRAKAGLPPKWSTVNPSLAALVPTNSADLKSTKTASLHSRKKCIYRIWNKTYAFGSNRCKGLSGEAKIAAARCSLCGLPDNPQHLYVECPGHSESAPPPKQSLLAGIRESIFDDLHRLSIVPRTSDNPTWRADILDRFRHLAFDTTQGLVESCWHGMFSLPALVTICQEHSHRSITMDDLNCLCTDLLDHVDILTQGAKIMLSYRSEKYFQSLQYPPGFSHPHSSTRRVARLRNLYVFLTYLTSRLFKSSVPLSSVQSYESAALGP